MQRSATNAVTCLILAAAISISGCGNSGNQAKSDKASDATSQAAGEHSHPTEGPHHGSLIELGDEEYHGELVHDDKAGTVTIYLLDSSAREAVAVELSEVHINASHDGQSEQFALAARPMPEDPEGKSSRFVSEDSELAEHLDEEGADARLVLKISGKSYNAAISHDHDHGHDHE